MALGTREILMVLRARDQASRIVEGLGKTVGELGQKGGITGGQLATMGTGGVVIGGVGALALKWLNGATDAAMAYNKEAALTLTQVDSTKVSLQQVRDVGLQVAQQFPVAFDSVQKAFYDIFSSIDVNLPQAKALLTGFAKAAVAGNVDIQVAGRATIAILNAFHLPISDLNNVLDVQFQLVRKGVGTYSEFATTIGRAIPSAARAGQTVQTLGGMLAFLTRNGLSAAMASSSAARALDALSNPVAVRKMTALGISVKDAKGEFRPMIDIIQQLHDKLSKLTGPDRAKAIYELFKGAGGTIQARRFLDPAIKNTDQLRSLVDAMGKAATGSTSKAFNTMMNESANKAQLLANKYHVLKVQIGEQLIPAKLRLMEILSKILDWWNRLSPATQKLIVKFIAITATIMVFVGALMVLAGTFLVIVGSLMLMGLTFSTALLFISFAIAAVIGAIIAIGIAIVLAITFHKQLAAAASVAWDWIKKTAINVWNNYLHPTLTALANFFTKQIPQAYKVFVSTTISAWGSVVDFVKRTAGQIGSIAQTIGKYFMQYIGHPVAVAAEFVGHQAALFGGWFMDHVWPVIQAFGGLFKAIMDRITQWTGHAISIWKGLWSILVPIIRTVWRTYSTIITGEVQIIIRVIQYLWDVIVPIVQIGMSVIGAFFQVGWEVIKTIFDVAWQEIKSIVDIGMTFLRAVFPPVLKFIEQAFKITWNLIKGVVEAALKIIKGIIEIATGIIALRWGKVWQGIKDVFSGVWQLIFTILKAAWDSIYSAFTNGFDLVKRFVQTVPGKILQALGDVTLLLFHKGLDILRSLLKGIIHVWGSIEKFIKKLPGLIVSAIGDVSKILWNIGVQLIKGLVNGILSTGSAIADAIKSKIPGGGAGLKLLDASVGSIPGAASAKAILSHLPGGARGMFVNFPSSGALAMQCCL